MRKVGLVLAAATIIAALAACGQVSTAGLAPEDTILYVQAKSPQKLLAGLNDGIRSSGVLGDSAEAIQSLLALSGLDFAKVQQALDLDRPLVAVLSGSSALNGSLNILVPVRDQGVYDALAAAIGLPPSSGVYQGWNILTLQGQPLQYPLAQSLDTSLLDQFGDAGVGVLMDYASYMNFSNSLGDISYDTIPFLNEFLEYSMDIAASLDKIAYYLSVDSKAIALRGAVSYLETGDYADSFKAMAPAGTIRYLDRLSSEDMFGVAGSTKVENAEALARLYTPIFEILGASSTTSRSFFELTKKAFANLDGQYFASLTLDAVPAPEYDPDTYEPLPPIPASTLAGLKFGFSSIYSVRDLAVDAALAAEGVQLSNNFLKEIGARLSRLSGGTSDLPVGQLTLRRSDETRDGVAYERFQIEVPSVFLAVADAETRERISTLTGLLASYVVRKDNTVAAAMGSGALDRALALAEGRKPRTPLTSLPGYETLKGYLSPSPSVIFHYNVGQIAQIGGATTFGNDWTSGSTAHGPGLVGSVEFKDGTVRFDMAFLVSEIAEIAASVSPF